MKKLLNTLYITGDDLYCRNENVVVYRKNGITAQFPLVNLEGIITFSYAGASPALMGECAKTRHPAHISDTKWTFSRPCQRNVSRNCTPTA